jgi:hypothetical protein
LTSVWIYNKQSKITPVERLIYERGRSIGNNN